MAQAKMTFWTKEAVEEHFVVKQKNGTEPLTPINALQDHISNAIYQLFGVTTPGFYIGIYEKKLSLISNIMPGYKDLVEWLDGGPEAILEINASPKVEDCVAAYKKVETGLNIVGKESLLAAAIILEDGDVVGAGLRNIGLIESYGHHKIIKIDPSSTVFDNSSENIDDAMSAFESDLSLDNPFLFKPFSFSRAYNNPRSIVGNLHFSEFFHDINKDKLIMELAKFAYMDVKHIRTLVFRSEYSELLSDANANAQLKHIENILLRKQSILKRALHLPEIQYTPPTPPPVFLTDVHLSEPLEQLVHGASRPLKVKRIFPSADGKELTPSTFSCTS